MKKITRSENQTTVTAVETDKSAVQADTELKSESVQPSQPTRQQQKGSMKRSKAVVFGISLVAILAGVGTGFGVHALTSGGSLIKSPEIANLQEGSPTE